ncbi:hypothetical protein [Clostridium neonatale]|uniref:Uncharacterized protein n=1 Tax=Clostridium neonatale TaxID=137838 RepID=A0AA86JZI1_9CLOT|nr:hypothetical protein [Clostridium neonatale]CAG9705742.1 conserved hypothetical protein [Clostridium neonatale]CAI3592702.1 conserved hypothetical protein [Clostridium neonatale]CAI3616221.1 conserved hypothetical protein [Clostridium neonatale]CAI3685206.1 conserved hypothetical protein [Clostridium neonatale]CAI3693005.1 conserved hypothetical protein [Clostridium neonatale]
MKKDMENLIANIYTNMNNVFKEDDDITPVMPLKVEDVNEEFFTAELMAMMLQFQNLTGQDVDIIDFTHILNKLAIQYMLDNRAETV